MENSSYEELVKKIASLQAENTHLRQYVHYKSNHVTKLERESTNMIDALSNHSQENLNDTENKQQNLDQSQNQGTSFLDKSKRGEGSFVGHLPNGHSSLLNESHPGLLDLSSHNRSYHASTVAKDTSVLNQSKGRDVSFLNKSHSRESIKNHTRHSNVDQSKHVNLDQSKHVNLDQSRLGILDQSKPGDLSLNTSHHREGLFPSKSQPSSLEQSTSLDLTNQSHSLKTTVLNSHSKPHLKGNSYFNKSLHEKPKREDRSILNQSQKGSLEAADQSIFDQSHLGEEDFFNQSQPSFLDQSQSLEGHEGGAEALDQNNTGLNESSLQQTEVMFSNQNSSFKETRKMGPGHRQGDGPPSIMASPGKRRPNDREFYAFMDELDQERTAILHDIESEDKLRKWYYEQLDVFTKKIESLPLTETYNLQADMNRRQLEYELQKLRDSLQENLGSSESIATRHEARLHKIHMIEREMLRLQQRHSQLQDQCRPIIAGNELREEIQERPSFVNASTNTSIASEAFAPIKGNEDTAFTSDRNVLRLEDGKSMVSIATQTAEVIIPDFDSLPEIPVPQNTSMDALYHGAWPMTKGSMSEGSLTGLAHHETASVMSFNSSNSHGSAQSSPSPPKKPANQSTKYPCFVAPQVEMVYSLLSMLGTHDKDDMSRTLLAMSSSQDSCIAMRQSGCMPLLIQLLHGSDKESGLLGNTRGSKPARARAAAALHNIVHSHPDDKRGRREARVLRLLEQIRAHCDQLRDLFDAESLEDKSGKSSDIDHHPGPAIAALMKLSFDEEHRHAICTLGGLQAIAELLEVDQLIHDNTAEQYNITMRRYACMALTNLTFGDGTNKALLCSMKSSMKALVHQLQSSNEDLCQVAASVLRNLSWRADLASKKTLREVGAVTTLMEAAMVVKKESTLKSILSALWNLSAHCSENKADICVVEDALVFLVHTLTYKSPSKTLAIIENGGGILRNVSSHVAIREDYRKVLRQHGCLQILLKHLRSPSLTIVSNACGTLWNLSARCPEDQQALWDMGAVSMLKNLLHSKHKMISMGSAAALKNLLAAKPSISTMDMPQKTNTPSLHVRKQRALEAEIDQSLSETCENVDSPRESPVDHAVKKDDQDPKRFLYQGGDNSNVFHQQPESEHRRSLIRGQFFPRSGSGDSSPLIENRICSPQRVARSGSQDSVGSVHSDISHDRSRVQNMLAKSSKLLHERQGGSLDRRKEGHQGLNNYASRSLDSAAEIYRGRNGSPANSRIMQVMKEVAMHNGLEGDIHQGNKSHVIEQQNSRFRNLNPGQAAKGFESKSHRITDNVKNMDGHRMMDNSESDEQPINYSMKYDPDNHGSKNNQNLPPNLNNRPPVPKIGNYVGSAFTPQSEMPNMVRNNFPAPKNIQAERNYFNGKPVLSTNPKKLNSLHENDFATDDLPTDYSRLYPEHSDEHFNGNQSEHYSSHYRDCADCKLEEARRTNDMLEQMMGDNDCVRTFYTEGTPLNYMSTATSMTDLSAHPQKDVNKTIINEEDETHAYTTHFEKEDNSNNGLSDSVREVYNDSIQERTVIEAEQDSTSPSEKPKTYCEEGTPICFSRVSSLSSLHSSDARDRVDPTSKHGAELQSIDEDNASGLDLSAKKRDKSGKPNKDHLSPGTAVHSPEKEHKTVTWDDNHQVQETPLMFSRCSSLGSLSSFDAHSVHSSVMSDYSRRPSGHTSPSDLPDSPSETMPPTPRCKSPSITSGGSDAAENRESKGNKTDTDKAAEAEERRDAQTRSIQLQLTSERSQRGENIQMAEDLHLAEDVPKTYATEDTPLNFSETTSLSGLSVNHDEPEIPTQNGKEEESISTKWSAPVTHVEDHDNNSSLSEVSEGEEDILAQCISSAMPNNSSRRMKKSASDNTIKKKVGFFKIENLNQSKSKLPTKVVNTTKAGPLSPPGVKKEKPASKKPTPHPVLDGEPDTLKSYATEGTPLNFSRTGSLSDLSVCTDRSEPKTSDVLEKITADDSKSDNSSFLEDHDDFLKEVIQSAMPKGKSPKKAAADRRSSGTSEKVSPKEKKQIPQPRKQTFMKVRHDSDSQSLPGTDSLKTFAVEGTPINFSTATSLSDLTMDSVEGIGRKLSDPDEENCNAFPEDNIANETTRAMSAAEARYEQSLFLTDVAACDSPRVYGMEGTPMSFSRNDSLSSLGCIDDDREHPTFHNDQSSNTSKSKLPKRSNQTSASRLPTATKSFIPQTTASKSIFDNQIYHREVLGQSSEESSQTDTLHEQDQTKKFEVEGTPYCFSRNSSLSSLHTDDNLTRDNSGEGADLKVPGTETNLKDQQAAFKVEGTPVCFSRNSSLSSLSIESSPTLPTQFEQDLLEQCISSAMPKGKSKFQTKPKGIPRPASASGNLRDKLLPKSHLHIHSEFDADFQTPTNSSRPRGGDSDVFYNSPASPSFSSAQHERFTGWRKQPHKSCDEIFTSSPYDEGKFNWRRSHSQDSENFLKQRKDVSNFEKAQIVATTENGEGHQDGRFRRPFLPALESLQATNLSLQDNKMLEETEKVKTESSQKSRDSQGSLEKVDSEKSDSDAAETCNENVSSVKEEGSIEDILKETLPENSMADTDDDLLASMEDTLAEAEMGSNETTFDNAGSGDTSCLNETVIHRPEAAKVSAETEEMSVENLKELEANANIVVSELFIEQELSSSLLEEDMFIENETISLVSNGYNSDTASEVSISWSTSSKTNSEQTSEYAASNNSQNDNPQNVGKGPRISKPSNKPLNEQGPKEDNSRAVRGRRKPLYPGKPTTPSKTGDNSRIGKPSNNTFKTPWNRNTPQPAKKVSPTSQQNGQASKISPKSKLVKPTPTSVSTPRPTRSTIPKTGSQSRLPTMNTDKTSPPANKSKGKPSPNERPKPPIKQGTFVKETSSLDNQGNKGGKNNSPPDTSGVKKREKRTSSSSSTPSDRHSGGSSTGSHGDTNSSPPVAAWGKALGEYNFLVDKSQEQGYHAPYEQIQMQRNAKECPDVLKRNSSNVTKTTTTTITVKISGNSPSGVSRIATSNLRKTTSMSPNRSGSSTALNRVGSAGNLKKTSSKTDLKKSDSTASIKKSGSNNSRPSTPSGRRTPTSLNFNGKSSNSPNGTPNKLPTSARKTAPGTVGKKQVTSKIASLWKKDDGGSSSGNTSDKSPPESRMPPKGSRVPTKKPAIPVKPKISPTKLNDKDVASNPVPKEGLSRSSTYDKIALPDTKSSDQDSSSTTSEIPVVQDLSFDSTNSDSPGSRSSSGLRGRGRLEFDSSTWKKEKQDSSENCNDLPDADETFGGTVWRRHDSDTEEDKPEVWVKQSDIKEVKNSDPDSSLQICNSTSNTSLNNASALSNSSFMNSSTASTASASRRLVRNFGSSSLQKAALSHSFQSGSSSATTNGLTNGHTEPSAIQIHSSTPLCEPLKKVEGRSNAAIVAPFNYKPSNPNTTTTIPAQTEGNKPNNSPGKRSVIGSPTKHMTKTEMLLARRRSYLNSVKNEESLGDGEEKKRTCLVTTV